MIYQLVIKQKPLINNLTLKMKVLGIWIPIENAYVKTTNKELRKKYTEDFIKEYTDCFKILPENIVRK